MAIALTHSGTSVYSSDSPSRELLVGTADGIVTLERTQRARSWRVAARALQGSHVSSMIIPQPDLMLAAIYHGGIMMSRDGGKSWAHRDNGIAHNDVYSLGATILSGKLRLLAGTEPARLYVSDDLGARWRECPSLRAGAGVARWTFPAPPHQAHVKVITVAPDDPSTIYASVEQGDLLRSTDAGETWQEITGFEEGFDFDVHRLVIHPKNPSRLYMMGGSGLCVSDDRGISWKRYTDAKSPIGGYPDQLTYLPSNPDVLLASGARANPSTWMRSGFAGSRIGISRDRGRTWQILAGGLPAPDEWRSAIEAMTLEESGASFSAFAGTTSGEVFASDDSGDTWSLIASGIGPISKGLHYMALNRKEIAGAAT
ncbi:MAG TPA: hypothetical protein VEC38_11770 [Candidatus Binataceae bacterium]|nr:hypothetical protein [Candidatus Binataceae bacterium]